MNSQALPITPFILEDLRAVQLEVLRNFTDHAALLLPASPAVPRVLYNCDFELLEFQQVIEEYLQVEYHAGFIFIFVIH